MSKELTSKEKKVLERIKNNLKIPKIKTKKPTIVAMIGLVGSGKSTTAREISGKIGAVLVTADDIRLQLRKEKEGYRNVGELVHLLTISILEQGGNVVLDKDHVYADTRNRVKKIAKDAKANLYYVETHCERDTMIGRIITQKYKKAGFWAGAGSEWKGAKKSAVVKLREMRRRTPHHYSWDRENGGKWIPKKHPFVFHKIETTDPKKSKKQVESLVKKLKK